MIAESKSICDFISSKRLLGLIKNNSKAKDDKKHYYRVADVICDLKHYCDKFKINYANEVRMANIYYEEEIKK